MPDSYQSSKWNIQPCKWAWKTKRHYTGRARHVGDRRHWWPCGGWLVWHPGTLGSQVISLPSEGHGHSSQVQINLSHGSILPFDARLVEPLCWQAHLTTSLPTLCHFACIFLQIYSFPDWTPASAGIKRYYTATISAKWHTKCSYFYVCIQMLRMQCCPAAPNLLTVYISVCPGV